MKILFLLFCTLILFNCSTTSTAKNELKVSASIQNITSRTDTSPNKRADSIIFITSRNDTCVWSGEYINNILNNHDELAGSYFKSPEESYSTRKIQGAFNSEAGQDSYYLIYSYLLQQKGNLKQYNTERKKLVDIYTLINSLYSSLTYGGTYYGHQYHRIIGYAEYSLYYMPKTDSEKENFYDITPQKKLYIESLKQLIFDITSNDTEHLLLSKDNRKLRLKRLNEMVNKISDNIDDLFFLRKAQEFQYSLYSDI